MPLGDLSPVRTIIAARRPLPKYHVTIISIATVYGRP
jgi:hypothetical protein